MPILALSRRMGYVRLPANGPHPRPSTNDCVLCKDDRNFKLGVAKRSGSKKVGPNAMNFTAGLQSFSDPVDEASLKRIEALFRSRAILHLRQAAGHNGAHNQAPKQVLGVVTLQAICEE